MQFSLRYNSDVRHLIKGITISSLIPLLRGGDLPGVYAFIGMTFWPVIYFIYKYGKFAAIIKFSELVMQRKLRQEYLFNQKNKDVEYVG
jgi:hypothetical protein